MTDKEKIIDGKTIGCPCYIDRPLHRYDKACSIQSQAFTEQQTKEKPILRCGQIKNCSIKENYKQLKRKEKECEELKEWQKANQPTGICETCTVKSVEDMYKYKKALDEIERFCKGVCDSCKKFTPNRQSDISCGLCQATQILNIINKVKEK